MRQYLIFIPNLLSLVRIILAYPILLYFYIEEYLISLGLFLIAALTDALDGFLARTFNWRTDLGKVLDPIADKILLIGMVSIFWINEYIPSYVFFILVFRDTVILIGAAFHMTVYEVGSPKPNLLGKITTFMQIIYFLSILIEIVFTLNLMQPIYHLLICTLCLLSLISYTMNWLRQTNELHSNES